MIVAGFGFRGIASTDSLADACAGARAQLQEHRSIAVVATAEDKARAPVFLRYAEEIDALPRGIDAPSLKTQQTATQSEISLGVRGTGSVAEAAALAAAGPGARLLGPRCISGDGLATCALAERKPK